MSFSPDTELLFVTSSLIRFVNSWGTFFKFLSIDYALAIGNLDGVDEGILAEVEVD